MTHLTLRLAMRRSFLIASSHSSPPPPGGLSLAKRNELRACPRRPPPLEDVVCMLGRGSDRHLSGLELDYSDLTTDQVLPVDVLVVYVSTIERRNGLRSFLLHTAPIRFAEAAFRRLVFLFDMLVPDSNLAKEIATTSSSSSSSLDPILLLDPARYIGLPRTPAMSTFEKVDLPRIMAFLARLRAGGEGLPLWSAFTTIPRGWGTKASFEIEKETASSAKLELVNKVFTCFKSIDLTTTNGLVKIQEILTTNDTDTDDHDDSDNDSSNNGIDDSTRTDNNDDHRTPQLRDPSSPDVFSSDGVSNVPYCVYSRSHDVPALLEGFTTAVSISLRPHHADGGGAPSTLGDATADAATVLDTIGIAAALSFIFVYIHPFEDGNGRLHRLLVHHLLAQLGQTTLAELPLSVAMLEHFDEYFDVLSGFSDPVTRATRYEYNRNQGITVQNETAALFRQTVMHAEVEFVCRMLVHTAFDVLPRCVLAAILLEEKELDGSPLASLSDMDCSLAAKTFDVVGRSWKASATTSEPDQATPPVVALDATQREHIKALYAERVAPLLLETGEQAGGGGVPCG
eukprot:TRINITY_DN3105_c0_g1_i1.p1 TRINITY_DN3105_c0_g1~~TRINITY_DN3105_c0_g1_i1.p1  ORF type:complete len:570 (+),score=134.00 TRINITY_DN3105_c0_g1_i1:298-2007(+)